MFDLRIDNASIIDGTGERPAFSGGIGISDGRIVEVGAVSGAAKRVINADGLAVTPGFVDIHTHYDGQASWDSVLCPSAQHGVTSIAMGNCGVGFAPVHKRDHQRLIGLLEGVEDIPGTALAEGLTWDWESFPDYLDALDRRHFSLDIGAHMPHAALRVYVMGERGSDHTAHPTDDEIDRMEQLTYEAVMAGAIGFSTSRSLAHRTNLGDNIGTLSASKRELSSAARALRRAGKGVFQIITDAYLFGDEDFVTSEFKLLEVLAEISARPLSFSLMQSPMVPDRWRRMLQEAERLVEGGHTVRAQVAPRPVGIILGLSTTLNPFCTTPTFKATMASYSLEERLQAFRQPEFKARLLAEHAALDRTDITFLVADNFDTMFRMNDPVNYQPTPDRSIASEARVQGREPVEYAYDVLLEDEGSRLFYKPAMNYVDGNLNAIYEMMKSPIALYGLSDGGAHCGSVCDASFPTSALSIWGNSDREEQTIAIEEVVHGYSERNAAHVGWFDRGRIAPGYLADLNIIDLGELALPPPYIVADLPAGGQRLLQKPRGYMHTIKSGRSRLRTGSGPASFPAGWCAANAIIDLWPWGGRSAVRRYGGWSGGHPGHRSHCDHGRRPGGGLRLLR